MIVSTSTLRDIYSSFNTVFNKTYEETPVLYPKIAMEVPSEASDENYAWLGAMPSMREWVGSRVIRNLKTHTYTIKNNTFEKTVSVNRNDIEDDRIGVYKPMIQDLAESSRKHPDKLVFGLLPRGFNENGYDGVPFISDAHPYLYANKEEKQSNKGTAKLTPTSYGAARASMMSLVDDEGEPLYIVPDLLVVSPQNEAAARRIVYAEEINHETNIYKGTAEVLVAPELVRNPDMWFLLCTAKVIKPFIFQNRRKPALVSKTNPNDDNVFFNNEFINMLREMLQLPNDASVTDIANQIAELLQARNALSLEVNSLRFEAHKGKADEAVLTALKAGKILPFQKDWAFNTAMTNLEGFKNWAESAPQVVPMGEIAFEPLTLKDRKPCSRAHELLGLTADDVKCYGGGPL